MWCVTKHVEHLTVVYDPRWVVTAYNWALPKGGMSNKKVDYFGQLTALESELVFGWMFVGGWGKELG
jgi:hypothetical protein